MQSVFTTSVPSASEPNQSCVRCFDRKVKCDRKRPACSACLKRNAECVYRPRLPSRRRRKTEKHNISSTKESETNPVGVEPFIVPVATSFAQYSPPKDETHTSHSAHQLPTPASTHAETELRSIKDTQLLQASGCSAFVDNSLWTRVAEELQDPCQSLNAFSQDSDEDISDDEQIFPLGQTPRSSHRLQHPSSQIILKMWETFKTNIDPLVKIIHVPTFDSAIKRAIQNLDHIPRGFEALMFAIYSVAVLSMQDAQCEQIVGQSRQKALHAFIAATRSALSRAKFMTTTSLVVLQALFLHVYSIRNNCEARLVFTLNGVILRIAEGIGIHRDGASLGLQPFETEIRRRIWWQIKMHDWKTTELTGLTKFGAVDAHPDAPKQPANVNDDEIYPNMTQLPTPAEKATDMMFCMIRIDICDHVANRALKLMQAGKDISSWDEAWSEQAEIDKDLAMKQLQDHMESRFIRFCDPAEPLHLMTMIIARSALDMYRFNSNHPRWWKQQEVPEAKQKVVWEASLRLIDKFNMAQSSPQLECFAWHCGFYMHWQPLIHILDTLRSMPLLPDAEKAWKLVETLYNNNPSMITNMKKPIQGAVGNLCLKAYEIRQASIRHSGSPELNIPDFIAKLSQQRDSIKADRAVRNQKRESIIRKQQHNSMENKQGEAIPDSFTATQNNGTSVSSSTLNVLPATATADENFWFAQSFDEAFLHASNGMMSFDPDFMLDSPYLVDSNMEETFDWAQWDALLSQTNFDIG